MSKGTLPREGDMIPGATTTVTLALNGETLGELAHNINFLIDTEQVVPWEAVNYRYLLEAVLHTETIVHTPPRRDDAYSYEALVTYRALYLGHNARLTGGKGRGV